jgi:hypothetical protein
MDEVHLAACYEKRATKQTCIRPLIRPTQTDMNRKIQLYWKSIQLVEW